MLVYNHVMTYSSITNDCESDLFCSTFLEIFLYIHCVQNCVLIMSHVHITWPGTKSSSSD